MNFKDKKKEKNEEKVNNNEIEIIFGEDSDLELEISDVGDYMNDLKPKNSEDKKKNIVIPKVKKEKK